MKALGCGVLGFLALISMFVGGLMFAAGSFLGGGSGSPENGMGEAPGSVPGMPDVALKAYINGTKRARKERPKCKNMRWSVVAGIGAIESGIAAKPKGGKKKPDSGLLKSRTLKDDGDISPPIIGPKLDGSGVGGNSTNFKDHDNGKWDGYKDTDAAVGPLQFIPQTWMGMGKDGNNDGDRDPNNIYDAALSTAVYLCGGRNDKSDLKKDSDLAAAIKRYNHSDKYVNDVTEQIKYFDAMNITSVSGSRKAVLARAKKWTKKNVPYSMSTYRDNYRTDCSGFVSMAWGLKRSYTTDQFHRIAHRIQKKDLKPGDILLNQKTGSLGHVAIFEKWVDPDNPDKGYWGYEEAGSVGAVHRKIDYPYFHGYGQYLPYRSNKLK